MLERDPIVPPERSRQRLPIVPMKPYMPLLEAEKLPVEKQQNELKLALLALKQIWRDIIYSHKES